MSFYTGSFPPHNTLASADRPRGGFMDRRSTGLFLAPLAIAVLVFMPGCVGNGTPNEQASGVQTVTLNPSNTISLELGTTQNFIASARNGSGGTVFGTIQYASDNNSSLTIS